MSKGVKWAFELPLRPEVLLRFPRFRYARPMTTPESRAPLSHQPLTMSSVLRKSWPGSPKTQTRSAGWASEPRRRCRSFQSTSMRRNWRVRLLQGAA